MCIGVALILFAWSSFAPHHAQPVWPHRPAVTASVFKVMLYDDEEGDCITPEDVWDVLEEDLAVADAVLWLGISFEQSASTEYFRKVSSLNMLE